MYLLDTNIWLERMLDQARSEEVGRLLDQVPSDQIFITDFSLHSIGVIFHRLNQQDEFLGFVQDVFIDGVVGLVTLEPTDMERLVAVIDGFGLDFDDAYQYVAAEKYDLVLVSFDSDFDGTERGRVTPEEIIEAE
jgi:hypothetical protein